MSRSRRALPLLVAAALAACTGTRGEEPGNEVEGDPTTTATEPAVETTSTAPIEPTLDEVSLTLQEIAVAENPVALAARPSSPDLYVAEKGGRVLRIAVTTSGRDETPRYQIQRTPVLDLSDEVIDEGERGLLGLAFSTDGRRLYVDYTAEPDGRTMVVEYELGDRDAVERDSRRVLLEVEQPYANHNGGHLAVGRDGFLYIGLGDGGGGGDPEEHGQNPETLLGSILRIDPLAPSESLPYAVPPGNPFADAAGGAPEVWLYGVRNPWRFSFDRTTGDLWVADVGQNAWEEITWLPATGGFDAGRGANLGWNEVEGTHEFDGDNPEGAVLPIHEYSHDDGACSITGGYLYRGSAIPDLQGAYLFADYCAPGLRAIQVHDGAVLAERAWPELGGPQIQSFGEDGDGELYVLSAAGPISKVVPG
ncbi:MAG: PQQ-dependent sugar dehydrogenase [Acidimicrobiia bacterium]